MKKIKMELSTTSVNEIKNKILQLQADLNKAKELAVEDMANFALKEIKTNYAGSPYTDGNDDVSFFKEKKENKTIVGVKGSQCVYREFGTGTEGLNAPHPIKNKFPLNDYNSGKKIKVNSKTGELFWIYKNKNGEKVYTQGIPAGKEVFNASVILKGKKYEILRRRVGEALSKL